MGEVRLKMGRGSGEGEREWSGVPDEEVDGGQIREVLMRWMM